MRALFMGFTFVAPFVYLLTQERWDRRWVDFDCRGARFSVSFPETPRDVRSDTSIPGTGKHNLVGFTAADECRRYTIAYFDFPGHVVARDPQHILNQLTDEFTAASASGPVKAQPLAAGEHPGREAVYPAPDGSWVRQRTLLVGCRFFVLRVRGPAAAVRAGEADRFLQSFRADNY